MRLAGRVTIAVAVILENQSNVNEVTGGVDAAPGLKDVLSTGMPWEQAVTSTNIPNLFLLPRGELSRNPGGHAPLAAIASPLFATALFDLSSPQEDA